VRGAAREPGSEEYLDSEKYQLRQWNLDDPASLKDFITRINRIRRENSALHNDRSLSFHPTDNEQLLCYSKTSAGLGKYYYRRRQSRPASQTVRLGNAQYRRTGSRTGNAAINCMI
jgi:hypothetical protein